jgi:hypothetical protein
MRVAGNDHVNSAGCGIQLQFMEIVQDVHLAPTERYHFCVGIGFRPIPGIDVPSDRSHRRNPAQSGDDVQPTDVARVDNMRHPSQPLLSLPT